MSERTFERWETYVAETARAFPYPPTPDVAGAVSEGMPPTPYRHRLAWAAVVAVIALATLLAVPPVRAGVVEVLRLGAIRVLLAEPTATPVPPTLTPTPVPPTATPRPTQTNEPTATISAAATSVPPTATPSPSPTPLASVLDLAGETTLAEARERVDFPILLPAYPPDLGPPDYVFAQDLGGPAAVLVWLEPGTEDEVQMSLHVLTDEIIGTKFQPRVIRETEVNGERALWAEGPYLLQLRNGTYETRRLVEGHVLIWMEGGITYRLESDLSLEEAARVAESLR